MSRSLGVTAVRPGPHTSGGLHTSVVAPMHGTRTLAVLGRNEVYVFLKTYVMKKILAPHTSIKPAVQNTNEGIRKQGASRGIMRM